MSLLKSLLHPRTYPATFLLLFANLAVFAVQVFSGVSPSEPTPADLMAWGGNLPALTLTGDYWRLAASMFLHGGWLHLLANMYMLITIGPLAERRFGSPGLAVIYLFGGLIASMVSASWGGAHMFGEQLRLTPFGFAHEPVVKLIVAVGASGALMAVCGALLASAVIYSLAGEPDEEGAALKSGLAQVILINLFLGFKIEGIDQAAHIGGLLGGLVLGLSVGRPGEAGFDLRRGLRLLIHVLLVPAFLWVYSLGTPDEGWLTVRGQLQAEADEAARKAQSNKAARKAHRAAAKEEASLPAPVSAEQAAGRRLQIGESASAMWLAEDEKTAYITDYRKNRLTLVDLASGEVLKEIAGPALPAGKKACRGFMCEGAGAADLALLPQRQLALVPSMAVNALAVIDLAGGKLVKTVPLGRFPRSIVVDKAGLRAYVHNLRDNSVSVVDLENWQVLKTWKLNQPDYSAPEKRQAMWFSADGRKLFVTDRPYYQVEVFDTVTLEPVTHEIPDIWFDQVAAQADDADAVYALSAQRVLSVANARLAIRDSWDFCESHPAPWVFATHRDAAARHLLALFRHGESIIRVANLDTMVTLGDYPVPPDLQRLQFAGDGRRLYALGAGGQLAILDLGQRLEENSEWELLCRPRAEASQ